MLKLLFSTLLSILFLGPGFAQTHTDSVNNHLLADTAVKHQMLDGAEKQPTADTISKRADNIISRSPSDNIVRHQAADSLTKHGPAHSSAGKHKSRDSSAKHLPSKNAVKPPAENFEPQHSAVKTINDIRYNAYLNGDDLDNMSLAGDLNHFPSPGKVLKYKKQLDLSPIQIGQLTKLADALQRKKLEMGTNIIRNEKMLDSLFHSHQIDEGSLIFYTNRSGLYYGELKGAILMACFNTEKLLTPPQIKKLEVLEKEN